MTLHAGWIGVGKMGEAMVERLLDAGIAVTAWNRSAEKCESVRARGAVIADTPASAANADIVFSMVLDDPALDALWQREDGPLAGSATVWVDCSSVSPAASARAAAAAAEHGVKFVAAPVSGNPSVVRAGNLIFAASGPAPAIGAARPYLEAIGRAIHVVGDANQATVVKICTNAALAVTMQAISEVLVLAETAGLRRTDLMEFVNDSALGSPFLKYKTHALTALDYSTTFTPAGMVKDLNLALGLASDAGAPLPIVDATKHEFEQVAANPTWAPQDFAIALERVAANAGVTLTPES
ncbi:MAG: NAD(P)-dependent oxidoreductase [Agromyces sp.]